MIAMYKAIARVASLNVPVLILGESGSGKELVAQSIHDLGDRVAGPFVAINCGAIPDTLLENELFGSTRGAFTDSRQDRRGALSRADGGTLFLDEIGDISPAFQVKLLRFLQDGVVTPLGSEKSHRVDVRLIAATHRDIKRLVADGTVSRGSVLPNGGIRDRRAAAARTELRHPAARRLLPSSHRRGDASRIDSRTVAERARRLFRACLAGQCPRAGAGHSPHGDRLGRARGCWSGVACNARHRAIVGGSWRRSTRRRNRRGRRRP